MGRSRVIGFLASAVFAGGAIGCGASLVPADAGAGTDTGGGAGSMSDPPTPQWVAITWGGVTVYIQNVTFPASLMNLKMTDQASPPALDGLLQFFPTVTWDPTSGAGVAMQDGCGSSLSQLQLVSCSKQTHLDRAASAPGCLVAVFTPEGTTGSFIHPNGATCDITSSTGDIHVPQDWFLTRQPELSPTAWGTVMFDCQGSDGTWLKLEADFTIPLEGWTLLC